MKMSFDVLKTECGDVGFVGYKPEHSGFIRKLISFFTRGKGESRTVAQHQFLVLDGFNVIESGSRRKRSASTRTLISLMLEAEVYGGHYIVFRRGITSYQKTNIQYLSKEMDGATYGYLEIGLHMADGMLKKIGLLGEYKAFFVRLGDIFPGTRICSGLVNYILFLADVVGKAWVYFSPDETFDMAVSQGWEVVLMDKEGADYWNLPKKKEKEDASKN